MDNGSARKGASSARSRLRVASASASAPAASGHQSTSRNRHLVGTSNALAERKSNVTVGAKSLKTGRQGTEQTSAAESDHAVSQSAQKEPMKNKRKRHTTKDASPSRQDKEAKTRKEWSAHEKAIRHDLDAARAGDKTQNSQSAITKAESKSSSAPTPRSTEAEEQLGLKILRAQLLQVQADRDQLQEQLNKSVTKVAKQQEVLSHVHSQCSCTICFELAWRPHVLSPCGHVFCASCLLMWFKRPLPNEVAIPTYITGEDRVAEESRRTLGRLKICPHCRERVTSTPAEVWMVKGLIESVEGSMRTGQEGEHPKSLEERKEARGENLAAGNELWKGIFQERLNVNGPLYDEMDDVYRCIACHSEVVDGHCSNPYCQRVYEDDEEYGHYDDEEEEELFHLLEGEVMPEEDDEEWNSEDDSFIDDGSVAEELESEDEDEGAFQLQYQRRLARNLAESDGEDDEVLEVDGQGRAVGRPPRRRQIIASLSDSDESDVAILEVRPHSPRMQQFSDNDESDRSEDAGVSEADTLSEDEDSDVSSEDDPALHDANDELEDGDDDDYSE